MSVRVISRKIVDMGFELILYWNTTQLCFLRYYKKEEKVRTSVAASVASSCLTSSIVVLCSNPRFWYIVPATAIELSMEAWTWTRAVLAELNNKVVVGVVGIGRCGYDGGERIANLWVQQSPFIYSSSSWTLFRSLSRSRNASWSSAEIS